MAGGVWVAVVGDGNAGGWRGGGGVVMVSSGGGSPWSDKLSLTRHLSRCGDKLEASPRKSVSDVMVSDVSLSPSKHRFFGLPGPK